MAKQTAATRANLLSLRQCARETIENEAVLAVGLSDRVLDDGDHNLIADETA